MPEIETQRLLLRPIMENDADMLYAGIFSDPNVTGPSHLPCTANAQCIRRLAEKARTENAFYLSIILKQDNEPIGIICQEQPLFHGCLEIGFALRKTQWLKGYAAEALKGLIEYLLQSKTAVRITCTCDADNDASMKTMQKCGMHIYGRIQSDTEQMILFERKQH